MVQETLGNPKITDEQREKARLGLLNPWFTPANARNLFQALKAGPLMLKAGKAAYAETERLLQSLPLDTASSESIAYYYRLRIMAEKWQDAATKLSVLYSDIEGDYMSLTDLADKLPKVQELYMKALDARTAYEQFQREGKKGVID